MPAARFRARGAEPLGGRGGRGGGTVLKVALAQVDPRIGDFEGNVRRLAAAAREGARRGADLVVLPELAVPGYPPRDLLFDRAFVDRTLAATADLARELASGPPAVVGTLARSGEVTPGHPGLWNAAALLAGGRVTNLAAKRLLPSYDVFHETRWFRPGPPSAPVEIAGKRIGFLICEDLWDEGYPEHPPAELVAAGAELLIAIAASPYRSGILPRRLHHAERAARQGVPVLFVNTVGANDELIFDGRSFVLAPGGALYAQLPAFREAVEVVAGSAGIPAGPLTPLPAEEELFEALSLGVRDFAAKNGLRSVFLGLSGGVDSALTACIAAAAVGPSAVTAVALPSRHTDPRSTESARELAETLGIGFEVIPLAPLHDAAREALAAEGTVDENLQARLRMLILTALVNRRGGLLLNTSNKTELSLGYGTLYGDMAGTLSVLGDLTKPQIYELARWVTAHRAPIPPFILDRPPTAELRPDQVDPFDYDTVAPAVESLVRGHGAEDPSWSRLLHAAEHKRWQHGVILKVSDRAFGSGRMIPITTARPAGRS